MHFSLPEINLGKVSRLGAMLTGLFKILVPFKPCFMIARFAKNKKSRLNRDSTNFLLQFPLKVNSVF